MKNLTPRLILIGLAAVLGLLVLFSQQVGLSDERPLKLGIDLSGGTILVYQVEQQAGERVDLDELVSALKRRINPEGVFDITIRSVGQDRVEIIMPEEMANQAEEVKRKLTEEGSLAFRILASTNRASDFPAYLNRLAPTSRDFQPIVESLPEVGPTAGGQEAFRWAKLGEVVEATRAEAGAPTSIGARSITVAEAGWPPNRFRGLTAVLESAEGAAIEATIDRNTEDTLYLDRPLGVDAGAVTGVRVDYASGPAEITDPIREWSTNRYEGLPVLLEGVRDGEAARVTGEVASNTADTLTLTRDHGLDVVSSYRIAYNPSSIAMGGDGASISPEAAGDAVVRGVRVPSQPGTTEYFVLYEVPRDTQDVTGDMLERVYPQSDEQMRPAVGFDLDSIGARRFGSLTGRYRPRQEGAFFYNLAIILDGEIMSAPRINDRISDRGIITVGGQGGQAAEEVNYLIDILRAGSLPVALQTPPLQEETIGPTLGEDTIRKGVFAITVALALVPIFMIVYYQFAGVVSVIALLLNMVLLLASMALTGSSITLPGLAGLALTIGMAVDANVLIYERMREERDRGAPLGQQIRNGFGKAWSTILDSNLTTVLTGIVLWSVGTEEVKGFALVTIIGLLWNLFTAVFVSRTIFELAYQKGWIKRLTMLRLLNRTNIDFVGPRRYCMVGSALVIALGLSIFFSRGGTEQQGSMYNIDFTGGSLVTVRLDDEELGGQTPAARISTVRDTAGAVLPNVTVESLTVSGEEERGEAPRYNIRTTEQSPDVVQEKVLEAFSESLVRVELISAEPIPAEPDADPDADPTGLEGNRYRLTFNLPQPPSRIADAFAQILASADPPVASPRSQFRVANPDAPPNDVDQAGETLVLSTSLAGDRVQPYLALLGTELREDRDFLFERLENFGSVVAGETRQKAIVAIVASWLIIIGYLWFRFQSIAYGVAAVIALIHDVLIALGAVALAGYKIDLPMIAAFLTLIGFSVNDTIVIFDRIRELRGKSPNLTPRLVNEAINVTLSRTILTSLTTWMVVMIFWLFGGEGLSGFSFCLVIGFISGTYSTIFIAAPILIEWIGKPSKKDAGALATSR
ncbi:protein translocase subunit SecD [Tautonia plasticadhaerens]|uniref:Multifunctional fusion protein n=1 Tax=Tautonia plasticadhaerens TaxID=2527974 RepID=A0A518GXN5_9BACT|nr:protein translocase subunit SecD [Tautonia plasticadhaerens]QDV33349.1 bifunctional preprotein translocase subunit SecD/SecF [Tautonia plasticadhaerens]